jgi:glycosyltransferase involved in cell wall biosynthesis
VRCLPIVATSVGGVPELVVDGHTGLLVPARNTIQMSDAIFLLMNDRRYSIGAAGLARAQSQFTIERSSLKLAQMYSRLVGLRRKVRAFRGLLRLPSRATTKT